MPRQQLDVPATAAQGRNLETDGGHAIVEILAEQAFPDHGSQIAVGSRQHPHIHANFTSAAHVAEHRSIQDSQQVGLRGLADLSDLVEKDGAAMGHLKEPGFRPVGPCERPALVAEQLALQQVFLQCGAIHNHERPGFAAAARVNQFGQQLLAGAGFAADEHRGIAGAHALDQLNEPARSGGVRPRSRRLARWRSERRSSAR